MTSQEIRQQFFDFFKNKDHRIVDSAPVVPHGDPTLLFTNAGMNQFKDVFLGKGTRDYNRAADTQKCIRVSGKHNDLEEVGHDTYHHTFFEMLGNWSFGDYYKEEAIIWAWELLTEVWKLPKERLWATVYRTDDEAFEIWKTKTDINPNHILRFDEKDNFWEMGDTGPCGPCSEIHINLSDDPENASLVNAGVEECIEIWNLVFIQYNRDTEGTLHDLPNKHVDTGMGFERVTAVLQNKKSNYDTDVFQPIIQAIAKLSGMEYNKTTQAPMQVIADHIRTLTFAIGDGAVPGNDGRGYVLRRILRRASRYGRKLNLNEPFMFKLVDVLAETMGDTFKEIVEQKENIKRIIKAEEESFNKTLDRGLEEYVDIVSEVIQHELHLKTGKNIQRVYDDQTKDWIIEIIENGILRQSFMTKDITPKILESFDISVTISGENVFKLYDTYGFPVDLIKVMAREQGLKISEREFERLMSLQKERARKATKGKMSVAANALGNNLNDFELAAQEPTEFTGYSSLKTDAQIVGLKSDGNQAYVILNKSPFYAESGGQIDDHGKLIIGDTHLRVDGLVKINNQVVHIVNNETQVKLCNGDKVTAVVDEQRRWDIMRNHSATHFLHKALREVLGNHVQQSGSYVGPDRLRFDFTHFEKMTEGEIDAVESLVNEKLLQNIPLQHHKDTPFDKAKEMGAMMFFGDKYGDKVNVVQFGDYTMEFCGGTHVHNSSQIGLMKIVSESSIASGIRRIEAVTGRGIAEYIKKQEDRNQKTEVRVAELLEEKKKLEKELAQLQLADKMGGIDSIISSPVEVQGINVFKGKVDASNMDELKSMGDELRNKIKSGAGLLIAQVEDKVQMVAIVTDDLVKDKKLMAGKIVGDVAKLLGGGGGGRPHMATAGGKDISKIDEALAQVEEIVGKYL